MGDLQFQNLENYNEAIASYTKLVKESPKSPDAEELLIGWAAHFFEVATSDAIKVFHRSQRR